MISIITDRKRLREPSEAVSFSEGSRIGQILVEELSKRNDALGLAAPQIGIKACVFAIKNKEEIYYVINPKILSQKDKFLFKKEGCLSFPGQNLITIRHNEIEVIDDRIANPMILTGVESVCFQHELQHLQGGLFFDSEVKIYDSCFCGSGKKLKFCCLKDN